MRHTFAAAALLFALPGALIAQQPESPRNYWLVVTGLSGEPAFAASHTEWARQITSAAEDRFGATEVWWLAEKAGAGVDGVASKANITTTLAEVAAEAKPADALFLVFIGHGASSAGTSRISLPGPDLNATELAALLAPVRARVTVINTASASGGWLEPLAAPGRIVMTATKSGSEQNATTFGQHFATALTLDAADIDKDERISVQEAFDYARTEVERSYAADRKLLTEHAQISGDASLVHFGAPGARTATGDPVPQSPELRALYAEKARLEQQLASLRARSTELPAATYQAQLEALLLEVARNGQAIRRLEGDT